VTRPPLRSCAAALVTLALPAAAQEPSPADPPGEARAAVVLEVTDGELTARIAPAGEAAGVGAVAIEAAPADAAVVGWVDLAGPGFEYFHRGRRAEADWLDGGRLPGALPADRGQPAALVHSERRVDGVSSTHLTLVTRRDGRAVIVWEHTLRRDAPGETTRRRTIGQVFFEVDRERSDWLVIRLSEADVPKHSPPRPPPVVSVWRGYAFDPERGRYASIDED